MASRLIGLKKKLTWSDYGTPKQKTPPAAGHVAVAAHTDADWKGVGNITYTRPPNSNVYKLADTIQVQIVFNRNASWVASWVFTRPKKFQNDLLNHEQGHYNVAALLGRDYFIDLMQLKANAYTSPQRLVQDVEAVKKRYGRKVSEAIIKKYDDETKHGMDPAKQAKWDKYFNRAFTELRNPRIKAPDGVFYKVPFLDVLSQANVYP